MRATNLTVIGAVTRPVRSEDADFLVVTSEWSSRSPYQLLINYDNTLAQRWNNGARRCSSVEPRIVWDAHPGLGHITCWGLSLGTLNYDVRGDFLDLMTSHRGIPHPGVVSNLGMMAVIVLLIHQGEQLPHTLCHQVLSENTLMVSIQQGALERIKSQVE